MSRLTNKDDRGRYYTVEEKILIANEPVNPTTTWITNNENRRYGSPIDKLGKLEDLEEQLGCPLECMVAVFKAMKQDLIYCDIGNGMYNLHNFRLDYVDLADDVYFTRSEYHYVLDDDCCIFVKDYKKTWWLKEDKSE